MVKVIWTEFALEDLKAVHEYIRTQKFTRINSLKNLLTGWTSLKTFPTLEDRFQNSIRK